MRILAMKEKNWLLRGLAEFYLEKKKAVKSRSHGVEIAYICSH